MTSSFWLSAPLIAAVKVKEVRQLQRRITIVPKVYEFRLTEVSAEVENVLSGQWTQQSIVFYFFANELTAAGYHTVRYWLQPGERWIVFLRDEGGTLRTMTDLEELHAPVKSGLHAASELPSFGSPGEKMSYILLTPGRDFSPKAFTASLGQNIPLLQDIAPIKALVSLLRKLSVHPDKEIRSRGCLTLAERYPGQDECLETLRNDSDLQIRDEADKLLDAHRRDEPMLLDQLKRQPMRQKFSINGDDLPNEIDLYTTHRNPAVRNLACKILANSFPTHRSSYCSSPDR